MKAIHNVAILWNALVCCFALLYPGKLAMPPIEIWVFGGFCIGIALVLVQICARLDEGRR